MEQIIGAVVHGRRSEPRLNQEAIDRRVMIQLDRLQEHDWRFQEYRYPQREVL